MRKPPTSGLRDHCGAASSSVIGGSRRRAPWALVFSAILLATLALATTTQASSGLIGYFELGGEFEGALEEKTFESLPISAEVDDTAVNANGVGGASAGDVYVFGHGIRQLSASDQFVRLWGADVVKGGPDQANETQVVRVDATGGTFKLSFGSDTTADIPANAVAGQVESALNGLASIDTGGVSVTGGPGDAGGTNPYIVTFDGSSFAGTNQPQLKAANGSTPLSGAGAVATTYTTNTGRTGFEVCEPANGDECGDTTSSGGRIAIDQASGDVYVTSLKAIEKYSATGQFLRAWGRDVVAAGPDDSTNDEQKRVTVKATGGTFTLGYRKGLGSPAQSTPALPYNASAAAVESALNNLTEIGGEQSSVTVSGGPGNLTGSSPYLITFHGLLGGDDLEGTLVSNPSGLTISSGTKSADVETVTRGGGFEICKLEDACKAGSETDSPDALSLGAFFMSIAVAPPGAPNAGNIVVGNGSVDRVQEYSSDGTFVRTFGWDVDATEPSTGFEVCTAESGHACQQGSSGSGVGQLSGMNDVTEDSTGAIYTVEDTRFPEVHRVQKFIPGGGLNLTPTPFGTSETQALTVNAGAGQFKLVFGIEGDADSPFSTEGTGDLTPGSTTVTNVNTTVGQFEVGLPIAQSMNILAPHTFITAVGPNTLTLSKPVRSDFQSYQYIGVSLRSTRFYKTPNLPYNASAGEVESALNSLPSISAVGGSVSVTGGPGDTTGSAPYSISFDGGPLARTDPAQIVAAEGTTPLSGGSGVGANMASVVTTTPGGPGGINYKSSPFDLAIGSGNRVVVAKNYPTAAATCADGLPSLFEIRVEELDASGSVLQTSDPCTGLDGVFAENNREASLTVNSLTGYPYLLSQNTRQESARVNIFGPPPPAPDLTLEPISNITATSGILSGTVNPNGPGASYPNTTGTPRVTKTTYRVEYKKDSDSNWTAYAPDAPVGNGTTPAPFTVGVGGLVPKTEYDVRVIATKPFTGAVEETKSFTTLPAPPEIEAFSSGDVTASSATLHALINPQGSETTYHFEYGTTPAYGKSTPEIGVGESHQGQSVQDQIQGLQDTVYHFHVVATNPSGTAVSPDQTFTFHAPVCPNQTVRQQTRSAYLPDCRAYELVSPEDAGGTTLYTGGPQSPYATNPPRLAFVGQLAAIPGSGRNPINTVGDLYVATRGAEGWRTRYIGPSAEEAGCVGGRPIVSATGTPSTIQNDVMADPGLNRIIDWNLGNPLECTWGHFGPLRFNDANTAALGSNAPYVWNGNGDLLDRWPTSVADVPGSEANLSCPQDPNVRPYPEKTFGNIPVYYFCSTYVDASKDLNHFVFSTQSGLYGEGGLTKAPGSAYDNDTASNTLQLISKLPNGNPIDQEPGALAGPEELIQFPAVSADGSHILMGTATKRACKHVDFPFGYDPEVRGSDFGLCPILTQPTHLYMRVDDAVTYDVSGGKAVEYVGSTSDGRRLYFTTAAQVTGDDTDESTDLYMWDENNGAPQLVRVSAGQASPVGNSDNCASTWTTDCDVRTYEDQLISTNIGNRGGLGSWDQSNPNPGYTDNAIADKSGDIYFYSPEQLVAGKGTPGKENLYVYRAGSIRHVATLNDDRYCIGRVFLFGTAKRCSDGAVGRLQVTPDGHYAAFVTTTNVTAYDSHGRAEMYRYDAEAEKVICVSCRPDGSAPADDVLGSEGGRFITDDGRVFFDTTESLDPRDSNGGTTSVGAPIGPDVYEFVDGRPQLITTGTGTDAPGPEAASVAGLYGVSANGVDVYFGTYEKLVGQDRNGKQLKFYDARTNGGFSFVPPPAPCAAADECHGPSSAPPAPLVAGTDAMLGAGGNAHKVQKAKHHKRKHRKGKAKRASQRREGRVR